MFGFFMGIFVIEMLKSWLSENNGTLYIGIDGDRILAEIYRCHQQRTGLPVALLFASTSNGLLPAEMFIWQQNCLLWRGNMAGNVAFLSVFPAKTFCLEYFYSFFWKTY